MTCRFDAHGPPARRAIMVVAVTTLGGSDAPMPSTPARPYRLKAYPSDNLIVIPVDWRRALRMPGHVIQGNVLAFAADRAGLYDTLAVRVSEHEARQLARRLRYRAGTLSVCDQVLIDAGVADRTQPGLFAYYQGLPGEPVIEILPGGTLIQVAVFRKADGPLRVTAERITP
jgi:hypothetical protein